MQEDNIADSGKEYQEQLAIEYETETKMKIILNKDKKCFKDEGLNSWGAAELTKLEKGDRFRIYTTEGKPLVVKGQEVFVVASDPYKIADEWVIEVEF